MIALIVAYTKSARVIGKDGKIPWNIPDDLQHFQFLTEGNAVIFGRKTFESIGHTLKNRLNIVVTRSAKKSSSTPSENQSLLYANRVEEAFSIAKNNGYENIFVCGGQNIYKEALPFCNTLYLTEINKEYDGDTFFPKIDETKFKEIERIENNGFTYRTMERI
ncbi:MAG: dihydrofolate reductase [Treponema sp.]|nr:dihydrofolate reductase [Treponema sp.]